MADNLTPYFVNLIREALLKSFWYKPSLLNFLRQMRISPNYLANLRHEVSKRVWLDRLFVDLPRQAKGPALLQVMAAALAEQTTFPDLKRCEDSAQKIAEAEEAVGALRQYFATKKKAEDDEREAAGRRESGTKARIAVQKSAAELDALKLRLDQLAVKIGTAGAGYEFQKWFYDLMDYFDVVNRRPYTSDGRQIDGSESIDGTTYLVELKFTADQSGATDIDSLLAKVTSKADNTMGIMVSMSSYSSVAIDEASRSRSPLLLIDYSHLYYVLLGSMTFPDLITRIRRHSAQEGKAFLPVNKFGG